MYVCIIYIYTYIYICPTQNVTLAWQSQIKKPIFLLRVYMDHGGYCTYCTVNCTVSETCPSSNIALRKSNT